jgi:hypothetical protein
MLLVGDLNMQDWDERALDLRDKLGWALLGVVMITVAINLVRALLKDTKQVLSYLRKKRRKCLRKAKKDIGSQNQKTL